MSLNKHTVDPALPSSPLLSVAKRMLSSSPASVSGMLSAKRIKVETMTPRLPSSPLTDFDVFGSTELVDYTLSTIDEDDGDTPGRESHDREMNDASSDLALPSDDGGWLMNPATSESNDAEGDKVINIAPEIKHYLLQRGPDQQIGQDAYPTVVYINRQTGKMYQCIVDRELFFRRRDLGGFDDRALWLQANVYIGNLRDSCINSTDDSSEKDFPILHRHGNHFVFTSDPLTTDEDVPSHFKDSVKREWRRLTARYGDLNDLQNEQKSLIDKTFYLLRNYQTAIASRDLLVAMRINNLLDELRAALNDLLILEYVVRELFYRDSYPQFILATSSD